MGKRLILFVHGLGGHARNTWGNFEKLLQEEAGIGEVVIEHFSYPSFLFRIPFGRRYPRVQTLATALATQITHRFASFEEVTLVCHSLGGLIGKQFLIDQVESGRPLNIKRVLFYAVPNNGAGLASVADHLSWRHAQLQQLCRESDLTRQIAKAWERNQIEDRVDVHYVVAALDRVVDEFSARESWSNAKVDVIADKGHIDVAKPLDKNDLSYLILKNALIGNASQSGTKDQEGNFSRLRMDENNREAGAQTNKLIASEIRVAVSALVRIERNGKFLLVRNLHRPESFAPFGGVYKYFPGAKPTLDRFDFRPHAVDGDMTNDIRGFISMDTLNEFSQWFLSEQDRESSSQCIQRELREELEEVGLTLELITPNLHFQSVRSVSEGPEYIPSEKYDQFRIFDVFDLLDETEDARQVLAHLESHSLTSQDLLWASPEEIIKGRSVEGLIIAATASYLFGKNRYRSVDPSFGG